MHLDITALAHTAAQRFRESKDHSKDSFYRITEQVVRGQGVTNSNIVRKRAHEVRLRMNEFSAAKHHAEAEAKKDGKRLAERIAP